MPHEATVAEISQAYEESWRTMNKSIALYRDGSKLSQPLMSGTSLAVALADEEEELLPEGLVSAEKAVEIMAEALPTPDAPVGVFRTHADAPRWRHARCHGAARPRIFA